MSLSSRSRAPTRAAIPLMKSISSGVNVPTDDPGTREGHLAGRRRISRQEVAIVERGVRWEARNRPSVATNYANTRCMVTSHAP